MKKLILSLLISLSITTQAAADSVKIAALINGEIISTEDISDQIDIFMVSSPIPFNADTQEMITRRVLAQAVELKLKNQAAEKEGISVSEEEINQQLNQWAKKNNTTLSALKNRGINKAALAANVKAELAWIKLIRKKYYQTGSLTQKEINETIEEVTKDMSVKKYQVLEIFIKKENATDIEQLVEKLREDSRFELYAARFSEAPSAANGGNLGWINSGKMLSALEMRLSKMSPGEVSDAILIGNGYYILKLLQVFDPAQNPDFTPNQEEIKVLLENQKMEAISKKLLQNLKQKAIIEINQ
ncbi:MAG: peptidylprolyl isomerase [bacterium]|nr:peptidylprolyl isomerase [bacterium]MDY2829883.1 peptidylprolyl isomerase [Alphaproteobacteria bacterium]